MNNDALYRLSMGLPCSESKEWNEKKSLVDPIEMELHDFNKKRHEVLVFNWINKYTNNDIIDRLANDLCLIQNEKKRIYSITNRANRITIQIIMPLTMRVNERTNKQAGENGRVARKKAFKRKKNKNIDVLNVNAIIHTICRSNWIRVKVIELIILHLYSSCWCFGCFNCLRDGHLALIRNDIALHILQMKVFIWQRTKVLIFLPLFRIDFLFCYLQLSLHAK